MLQAQSLVSQPPATTMEQSAVDARAQRQVCSTSITCPVWGCPGSMHTVRQGHLHPLAPVPGSELIPSMLQLLGLRRCEHRRSGDTCLRSQHQHPCSCTSRRADTWVSLAPCHTVTCLGWPRITLAWIGPALLLSSIADLPASWGHHSKIPLFAGSCITKHGADPGPILPEDWV